MRRVCLLLVICVLLPRLSLAVEPRVALVIGNGRYISSPLTNPPNDAELIGETLRSLGFDVVVHRNTDQATMKRDIQEFGMRLEKRGPEAVGLFFYAGHGVQLNGRNYLIPVNAKIERDSDMEIEAVSADWVMEQMRYARNRLNIVILDACRNNPFVRSMRSADRGLAKMDAPAGVMIAYSTAPGDVAQDGDGRNSPYSEALAKAMREPNQPIEQMFKRTRISVIGKTASRQTPWESSSLTGDFYFTPDKNAPTAAPLPQPLPPPAPPPARIAAPVAVTPTPAPVAAPAKKPVAVPATAVVVPKPAPAPAPVAAPVTRSAEKSDTSGFKKVLGVFSSSSKRVASAVTGKSKSAAEEENFCELPVGNWKMAGNHLKGQVQINADHTSLIWKGRNAPAVKGSWSCDAANERLVFNWHDSVDTVTLSSRNRVMQGTDQHNYKVVYKRTR